jgi:ATP-dependent RNA helicase DeaD
VAVSLVTAVEQMELGRIAKRYSIEMQEWPLPSDEDVEGIVAERVTGLLEARLRDRDRLQVERMQRFEPLVRDLSESEEGRALLTMLLDDDYQLALHGPLPQPPYAQPASGSGSQREPPRKRSRRRT